MGLGFLTRQEGRSSQYLHDSARGTKYKLRRFNRIYVLETIANAQVHASIRVPACLSSKLMPKKHYETDLWFYFNKSRPVMSHISIASSFDAHFQPGNLYNCMATVLPTSFDGSASYKQVEYGSYSDVCSDLALCSIYGCVPESTYTSTSVSPERIIAEIDRNAYCFASPEPDVIYPAGPDDVRRKAASRRKVGNPRQEKKVQFFLFYVTKWLL